MLIDAVTLSGHNFTSIGDIEKIFASAVGFSRSGISNMLLKFSVEVAMVQNAGFESQYCTKSDSYIHLPSTFSYYSGAF